jgi:Flp pilus assembly protein TadD
MRTLNNSVYLLLASLITTPIARPLSQPTPVREADAVCERCHAKIFRSYLNTPMANASGLARDNLKPGTFVHSPSGTQYRITDGSKLVFQSLKLPALAGEWPLKYFLGSGHLGITYLYSIREFLFESPVAWYASSQAYDMKPGLGELDQMPPPLPMQSGCLRCHMSSVQAADAGTINRYQGLPFLHGGITCEACHGASEDHVRTKGKARIVNPSRLDADRRDSVCISCHLEGDISVERAGHSALEYRPGDSISTYLAYYVRKGAKLTDRAVSEVEQLSQSTCKRSSGDRMSCTSCHDPHFTPDSEHRVAFFRGKCLACHNQPEFARYHHPENRDCTACHMPRTGARNVLHVAWTDHRIRKQPQIASPHPLTRDADELTPIFSSGATSRDLAMANYKALLEGDRSLEPVAWQELNSIAIDFPSDKEALDALGNLAAKRGEWAKAKDEFGKVIAIDPLDLTALSNLGVLSAKDGKLKEARPLLEKAFDRNQDMPGLAKNLARVQCMAGDGAAARDTLRTVLLYFPHLQDVQALLTQMGSCVPPGVK